jgi:hypothetical protein
VAAHFALFSEGDPHEEAASADDSDTIMNEVCYLLLFMRSLMHAIS